jgi:hypothetical protein
MELKGKIALFPLNNNLVNIVDAATGNKVQKHDTEGTIGLGGASVQQNIAAIAIEKLYHGVHLINLISGKVFFKYVLPHGERASFALSKDTLTLAVGSETGVL